VIFESIGEEVSEFDMRLTSCNYDTAALEAVLTGATPDLLRTCGEWARGAQVESRPEYAREEKMPRS
jgi:hypothetical protein